MIVVFIEVLLIVVLAMILSTVFMDERKNRLRNMRAITLDGYWDGGERRSITRLDLTLEIKYFKNGYSGNVQSMDISARGVRLLLDEKLEKETPLRLEIKLPNQGQIVKSGGKVVWVKELAEDEKAASKRLFNTGIEFFDFRAPDNERLFDFLHNTSAKKR